MEQVCKQNPFHFVYVYTHTYICVYWKWLRLYYVCVNISLYSVCVGKISGMRDFASKSQETRRGLNYNPYYCSFMRPYKMNVVENELPTHCSAFSTFYIPSSLRLTWHTNHDQILCAFRPIFLSFTHKDSHTVNIHVYMFMHCAKFI